MSHTRHKQIGWILYDFANSTYHLLIPTILMPLYFKQYFAKESERADLQWALFVSLAVLAAGLVGPFIGAYADARQRRLGVLICTAFGAIFFAAMLPMLNAGAALSGGLVFSASFFFFTLSLGIYDAFLPLVAERKSRGTVSGLAWGVGYLGGLVALGAVFPVLRGAELPADSNAFRLGIWITCAVYGVFCFPSFLLLRRGSREPTEAAMRSPLQSTRERGFAPARVIKTIKNWRHNENFFKTLLSYYLVNDGLATLVYFTSIYAATTLGFESTQILMLFLVVQLVGVPASIMGGVAADRFGHKRVLYLLLGLWVSLCIGFAFCSGIAAFYLLSVGTGLVIGTTPAIYRSFLSDFVPRDKVAELYGFNSFASRASSIIGPLLFGGIASVSGSQRPAMLSLLVFFLLAGAVLKSVDVSKRVVESIRAK